MSTPEDLLRNFEAEYSAGLELLPELIELDIFDIPRPLDPSSLGISDRTFEDLTAQELEAIERLILKFMGIDRNKPENILRHYISVVPPENSTPDDIHINVIRTKFDNLVLQELNFPDSQKRWVFGPNQNI